MCTVVRLADHAEFWTNGQVGQHKKTQQRLEVQGDRVCFLSDLGVFSILVLRVYYNVYYSQLIHVMYYERIRVYYRYRHVIHCISMYYGVLDLEILIPYNTPLCRRDTCITRRCPNLL